MRKRCYYAVLDLGLKATLCEIRHSYHKLAMKWHPDKNKSNEAKDKFQEINEAYSILSDTSEKAWYDRHRETIVKNWNLNVPETSPVPHGSNSLTGGESFWPYYVRPLYVGYDDSESGFYSVYRNVFNVIGDGVEEMNVFVNEMDDDEQLEPLSSNVVILKAPSFGNSETKLVKVAQFYYYWEHLIPFIEVAWTNLCYLDLVKNKHITTEEQDWRKSLVKRFIEVIRNLIQYVKTCDPRYRKYLQNKTMLDVGTYDENELTLFEADNSQEIEIFNQQKTKRKICLECWNWANAQLELLTRNNSKNIDWAKVLLEGSGPNDISKACLEYIKVLAIGADTYVPKCFSSNSEDHKGHFEHGLKQDVVFKSAERDL